MEELLFYLVRVSVGTAAFYLFYLVFFSKRRQFQFNRIYLLISFLLSPLIPLITITVTRQATGQVVILPASAEVLLPVEEAVESVISLNVVLMVLYGTGVVIFLGHLITGHLRVWQISRKSRPGTTGGIGYFVTPEDVHPFTFFRRIVVPEESTLQPYFSMILRHEKIHADNRHTTDILLSEILFLIQWFNPFAWLMKDAIKNNLEYLTDAEVIREANPHAYQLALVALADKRGMAPFLNALNGNDLKNRIIMMKQKTENRNSVIRKLMVVPLTALLITGLSAREYKTVSATPSLVALPAEKPTESSLMPAGVSQSALVAQQDDPQLRSVRAISGAAETGVLSGDTVLKANDVTVITGYAVGNGQDPVTIKADVLQGSHMGNGIQFIRQLNYEKGPETGKVVSDTIRIRTTGGKNGPQPLYILDGKEILSIENIEPQDIESISVLKNESSTALYGEKGKNGVILITTKKEISGKDEPQPSSWGKKVVHFTESTDSKDALIIIDGKESETKLNEINPDHIASVKVLKGEAATEKYGIKGERGVVEIATKEGAPSISGRVITLERKSKGAVPAGEAGITNVEQLRQALARSIRYPVKAQESGQQGDVTIYAFVNPEGNITQITERKPGGKVVPLDEVVIVAYRSMEEKVNKKGKDTMDLLTQEGALQVKQLPALQIPEYNNKWVMFRFKFILQ